MVISYFDMYKKSSDDNSVVYLLFFSIFSFLFIPKHLFSMASEEILRSDILSITYNFILVFSLWMFLFFDKKCSYILSVTLFICLSIAILGGSTFSYTLINILFCSLLMSKIEKKYIYPVLLFNMTLWLSIYLLVTDSFSDLYTCKSIDGSYCYPTLGLKNPNSTAFILASYYYVLIGFIYNNISKNLTIIVIPFGCLIFYYLLSYFGSRTQSYLIILSFFLFFLLLMSAKFRLIVRWCVPYSIMFISLTVYLCIKIYDSGIFDLTIMNVFFSGRLYFLNFALNDISYLNFMFGGDPTKYLPLDNFTIYSIIHGGVLSLLFFVFISLKSKYFIKNIDIWSLVVIICSVLNSISESYSYVPFYNLGIMFIFSASISHFLTEKHD